MNEIKIPKLDPNLAQRLPFYYGWMMVPVAVIAQAVTGVGQTYGVSVFNPSLLETLGISLSVLTGAYMVGTLFAALPQTYIGYLMDRFWHPLGNDSCCYPVGRRLFVLLHCKFALDPAAGLFSIASARTRGIILVGGEYTSHVV